MDGEYEFDHNSDLDDDEDSEVDQVMQDVIRRDELSDSGFGQAVDDKEEKENYKRNPSRFSKSRRKNNMEEKLNEIVGADALLTLASSACPPVTAGNQNVIRQHLAMVSS